MEEARRRAGARPSHEDLQRFWDVSPIKHVGQVGRRRAFPLLFSCRHSERGRLRCVVRWAAWTVISVPAEPAKPTSGSPFCRQSGLCCLAPLCRPACVLVVGPNGWCLGCGVPTPGGQPTHPQPTPNSPTHPHSPPPAHPTASLLPCPAPGARAHVLHAGSQGPARAHGRCKTVHQRPQVRGAAGLAQQAGRVRRAELRFTARVVALGAAAKWRERRFQRTDHCALYDSSAQGLALVAVLLRLAQPQRMPAALAQAAARRAGNPRHRFPRGFARPGQAADGV